MSNYYQLGLPISILEVFSGTLYFHFCSIYNRKFGKKTVETLIRFQACGVWSKSALLAFAPEKD